MDITYGYQWLKKHEDNLTNFQNIDRKIHKHANLINNQTLLV